MKRNAKTLNKILRQLREKKGLSQRALADEVDITGAYIAQLETGVRTNPSLVVLQRLAKALKVPVAELLR